MKTFAYTNRKISFGEKRVLFNGNPDAYTPSDEATNQWEALPESIGQDLSTAKRNVNESLANMAEIIANDISTQDPTWVHGNKFNRELFLKELNDPTKRGALIKELQDAQIIKYGEHEYSARGNETTQIPQDLQQAVNNVKNAQQKTALEGWLKNPQGQIKARKWLTDKGLMGTQTSENNGNIEVKNTNFSSELVLNKLVKKYAENNRPLSLEQIKNYIKRSTALQEDYNKILNEVKNIKEVKEDNNAGIEKASDTLKGTLERDNPLKIFKRMFKDQLHKKYNQLMIQKAFQKFPSNGLTIISSDVTFPNNGADNLIKIKIRDKGSVVMDLSKGGEMKFRDTVIQNLKENMDEVRKEIKEEKVEENKEEEKVTKAKEDIATTATGSTAEKQKEFDENYLNTNGTFPEGLEISNENSEKIKGMVKELHLGDKYPHPEFNNITIKEGKIIMPLSKGASIKIGGSNAEYTSIQYNIEKKGFFLVTEDGKTVKGIGPKLSEAALNTITGKEKQTNFNHLNKEGTFPEGFEITKENERDIKKMFEQFSYKKGSNYPGLDVDNLSIEESEDNNILKIPFKNSGKIGEYDSIQCDYAPSDKGIVFFLVSESENIYIGPKLTTQAITDALKKKE